MPIPEPGPDEVLVKMHSMPINPSDLLFMSGAYGIPLAHPYTPGSEGSGEVVKAGPGDLSASLVGKRVCYTKNAA